MRRLRPRPLWLFLIALLGFSTWSACGDEGPTGGYSTTKPRTNHDDDEKDAGADPDDAGGSGSGGEDEAGKGGGGTGGAGGGAAGESGEGGDGEGGDGEGGDGEGGGGEGGSGPVELPDSPENPWIAFIEIDGSGFGQLNFIKADGSDRHAYGGGTLAETEPTWSPDGTKLAFTAVHEVNGAELHVLDFESGSDDVLDIDLGTMTRPRFTPDGETIVFAGAETTAEKSALYRADVEDGGAEAITEPEQGDGGHDIAPDGTVYFARKLDNNTFDIFSIDADADPSDDPVRITTGSRLIGGVSVHPDGTRVMYARNVFLATDKCPCTTQLVERTLSDGTERNIGEEGDEDATYFSGGDGLAVSRDSFDADSEIAVTDEDGVLTERVTDSEPFDVAPAVSSVESDDIEVEQF